MNYGNELFILKLANFFSVEHAIKNNTLTENRHHINQSKHDRLLINY